ncbi:bMERB domain-containing protein 1-like isoform X1 [Nerophis ophidion]|uniref:bMERB domain-containing protein 1-like isoform X1 n=1 Tax=Nerophis ophidion TaxID=159077 RepID=UPI002AE09B47|nr:bMERB domain-containing protein 1-like isoform X1 [Nerophis ophidion]
MMEMKRESFHQYGSLERTPWSRDNNKAEDDVVSMADSSLTADDIEGELFKIERIRDVLVRRESELRYMMDDIQLCKEITRLKKELHKLVSLPDKDKSNEDRQKEEELLQQIHKLVETRDFLVDDVEFERLREKEEDKEMADFLRSKFPRHLQKTERIENRQESDSKQRIGFEIVRIQTIPNPTLTGDKRSQRPPAAAVTSLRESGVKTPVATPLRL